LPAKGVAVIVRREEMRAQIDAKAKENETLKAENKALKDELAKFKKPSPFMRKNEEVIEK
jgi:cell division protein FtsB